MLSFNNIMIRALAQGVLAYKVILLIKKKSEHTSFTSYKIPSPTGHENCTLLLAHQTGKGERVTGQKESKQKGMRLFEPRRKDLASDRKLRVLASASNAVSAF